MSIRATELHGCPVISARTGLRLGRVRQVVIDVPNRRVAGFRLRRGGLLDRRWRLAAMQDVTELGAGGVVLPDAMALREDEERPGHLRLSRGGSPVIDEHGMVLGSLVDVEIDAASGTLLGLLLTARARAAAERCPSVVPAALVRWLEPNGVIVCGATAQPDSEHTAPGGPQ